jgi:hypothetical protein
MYTPFETALLDITVSHFLWDANAAAVGAKTICAPFKANILAPSGKKLSQQIWTPTTANFVLKTGNPKFPGEK